MGLRLDRIVLTFLFAAASATAQDTPPMDGMQMPGMSMDNKNPAENLLMNLSSGTAVNPAGWSMPMLMKPLGSWNAMFMAQAFVIDTQQSGPRGGDKFYSSNWFMANARASRRRTRRISVPTHDES